MPTLFKNSKILDGLGGVIQNGWLFMDGDTIMSLGASDEPLPEATLALEPHEIIDLEGKTLIPGLIDAHVHISADGSPDLQAQMLNDSPAVTALKMANNCKASLRAGFTTVRDLGGRNHVNLEVRDAINAGLIEGPTVISCGRIVCITGGHGWYMGNEADGPDNIRRAVREELKAGADLIKFMSTGGVLTKGVDPNAPQLGYDELRAGIEEAHNAGKKTTTHAVGLGGVKNAVEAGIDCIEHGFFMSEEIIEKMAEQGTWHVPTIVPVARMIELGRSGGIPDWIMKKIDAYGDTWKMGAIRAREMGIKQAMGTDTGTPFNLHGTNAEELIQMVNMGFEPGEVIICATSRAAELLGVEQEVGSIAPGKKADLVIVDGDPLKDISILSNWEKIVRVYKNGNAVSSE